MIARTICLLSLGVVAGLSYLFAVRHNPDELAGTVTADEPARSGNVAPDRDPAELPVVPSPDVRGQPGPPVAVAAPPESDAGNRGRLVYSRNGCATCHSIAGEGNPRYPLDGTGDRWEPDELRAWITGSGLAADLLNDAIRRRKQRYASLPEEDLSALVAYLAQLKRKP
jgi:mono/diheme cytochrome c family protein